MKIKRLNLISGNALEKSRYKSLEPFDITFTIDKDTNNVDPICLVGINGSGKSNLLELLAEIFFYLEGFFLKYIPNSFTSKFSINFELEYFIIYQSELQLVKIVRRNHKNPEYSIYDNSEEDYVTITDINIKKELLPKRIIGYSSGLNETLSTPFKTSRSYYSEQVGVQAKPNSRKKLAKEDVVLPRLMYMDKETNELIVVSNFLFNGEDKLKIFSSLLRIESLHSFRIIIQFNHPAAPTGGIRRTEELNKDVNQLIACATTYSHNEESESWILDYFICPATKEAFKKHFDTPLNLFLSLYRLSLLNPLCVKAMHRKWAITNDIFPSDKAFRIDNLKLNIKDPSDTINYIGISDGEHQFMHIIGTIMMFDEDGILYLLDEPETHFNPKWRAEFITALNSVITNPPQEIFITTHSPFILSDTRGHNVFVFKRDLDRVWFEPIGFETFGSPFDILLKKAFDRDVQISDLALEKLKSLVNGENDLNALVEGASQIAESYEKQFLIEKINKLILGNKTEK
jgi:restriction system-associated AAA family ATPase